MPTSAIKGLLSGVALALAAGAVAGQEAEPPDFPTQAELVVLDVVVRGDDRQPVTDLRPGEVEVLEDGLPCRIESFRLVRARPTEVAGRASPALAEAAPGRASETAANELVDTESTRRANIVILVFDRLGLEAARAARQAARIEGRAQYAHYPRFRVETSEERARLAGEEAKP